MILQADPLCSKSLHQRELGRTFQSVTLLLSEVMMREERKTTLGGRVRIVISNHVVTSSQEPQSKVNLHCLFWRTFWFSLHTLSTRKGMDILVTKYFPHQQKCYLPQCLWTFGMMSFSKRFHLCWQCCPSWYIQMGPHSPHEALIQWVWSLSLLYSWEN